MVFIRRDSCRLMNTTSSCKSSLKRIIHLMSLLVHIATIIVLLGLWIYFYIRAFQLSINWPWGFVIVILGVLISGYGFNINNQSTSFTIDFLFVLMLIGVFWNINNIRKWIYDGDRANFARYIGIGSLIGLVLGSFFILSLGGNYLQIGNQHSWTALISTFLQISVSEELLYRGFFLSYLRKFNFNHIPANLIQSVLFTLLHVPRYSDNWLLLLATFFSGFVAGYFTLKNKNLITAFFLHIVVNLVAVVWWVIKG
jgi:membrane protease YdiL (CAAX protease family)